MRDGGLDGCWAGIPGMVRASHDGGAVAGMDQGAGVAEGCPVGAGWGLSVVGTGAWVGGVLVGDVVGSLVGWMAGPVVGMPVGAEVGVAVGVEVGVPDWCAGSVVLVVALGPGAGLAGLSLEGAGLTGRVAAAAGHTSR